MAKTIAGKKCSRLQFQGTALLPLTRNAVGCNISANRINVDNFSECATLSHDDGTPYDELCTRLVMLVNKPEKITQPLLTELGEGKLE